MHINHRRRNKQEYPWDQRKWKVKGFRVFRSKEHRALERLRQGDDPDEILFPIRAVDNDNAWYYE